MLSQYLLVATGGALGALARFQIGLTLRGHLVDQWPLATLLVNVLGSIGIGVIAILLERGLLATDLRALLMVGFLGAFTTFSTFSLELMHLLEAGAIRAAAGYALASVAACLIGVVLGASITRLTI